MKKRRVMVLMHRDFMPPEDVESLDEAEFYRLKSEIDVMDALRKLGHEVQAIGVHDELTPIRGAVEGWQPHVVFNLLEEFQGQVLYDHNVVAYLELLRASYTGCNPRGLVLARDKALSKAIASYHRVRAPRFVVIRRGRKARRPRRLEFPLIVKSLTEESSLGISRASVVRDDERLAERVRFIHERIGTDAIVEEFIAGRELYVGLLGNERLVALPPQELLMNRSRPSEDFIATERVKHDIRYQAEHGVTIERPELPPELEKRLLRQSKRVCRALHLDGYARIDWRLRDDGELFFLEANPNPEVARNQEFSEAAKEAGLSYEELIARIVQLGISR
jgi:D-alanine-D-alanine ligase